MKKTCSFAMMVKDFAVDHNLKHSAVHFMCTRVLSRFEIRWLEIEIFQLTV